MRLVAILCSLIAMTGCGNQSQRKAAMTVDISLLNASSNALGLVELDWKGPDVPGGILRPGISKTAIDVEWPETTTAKVTFVDEATRKPYEVVVPLSKINEQVHSGKCRDITIRIKSYTEADVICK